MIPPGRAQTGSPAAELPASLDRTCELDKPPEPEEYEDYAPLTREEMAEEYAAAADELLAVEAAAAGRRGPGQPGSAQVLPGESASRAAAFGPGMVFDVLPGCAQLAVAADAAVGDDDPFDGVPEGELVGVLCAWDRVEAHAAARKLAVVAELARREPRSGGRGVHRRPGGRTRWASPAPAADELMGTAGHLDTHLPGTKAALLRRHGEPGQGPADRHGHRRCWMRPRPARPRPRCWTGRPG